MEMTWGPGRVIAGRYRLVSQLGQGGMGSVWRADHMSLSSPVAIKLIDPEIARRPEMLERFQREAQSSAALRSPHVVQILDYGVDEGVPFIAMEMLEGESLASRLARVGKLPYGDTVRIVAHVGRALAKAHEGNVIHRDLKPDNVFLVKNDDKEIAKVLDFGIAKITGNGPGSGKGSNATRTGSILGTPSYMSPEQAQGTKTIDSRSDLWSLAVIAFECVVGHVPFQSEALGDLLIKICIHPIPVPSQLAMVPPGFDMWWAKASSRDPSLRFQSGKDLAEALRQVLTPDVGNANSSGPMSPAVAVMGGSNTVGASPLHVSAFTPAGPYTPGGAYTPPPGAYGVPQQGPTLQSAGSQPSQHPSHPSQPGHYPSQPPGQQYTPLPPGAQQQYTPLPPQYTTAPGAAVNVMQPAPSSRGPMIALGVGVAAVLSGVGIWLVLGNNNHHDHHGSQATTQSSATTPTPLAVIPTPPGPDVAPAPTPVVSATAPAAVVAPPRPILPVKGQHVPPPPPPPVITIVLPAPPPPQPPPPPPTVTKPPDRVGF
jgi:serine/threonine-protein kinase